MELPTIRDIMAHGSRTDTEGLLLSDTSTTLHLDAFEAVCAPDYFEGLAQLVDSKTASYPGGSTAGGIIEHVAQHDEHFNALNPHENEQSHQRLLDVIARTSMVEIVRGFLNGQNGVKKETRLGNFMNIPVYETVTLGVTRGSTVFVSLQLEARNHDPLLVLDHGAFINRITVKFIRPPQSDDQMAAPSSVVSFDIDDHGFSPDHEYHKSRKSFLYDADKDTTTFDADIDPRTVLLIAAEMSKLHADQRERLTKGSDPRHVAEIEEQLAAFLRDIE